MAGECGSKWGGKVARGAGPAGGRLEARAPGGATALGQLQIMAFVPYALTRPFLFGLDPERAHDLTLDAIAGFQGTPLQCLWQQPRVSDPVTLAGLRFPNRIGLAAGLDKNGRCIDGLGAMGFGFIEVGTVTPLGQPHADEAGGLSGKPVFEASNRVIRLLRSALGSAYPIIGVGGVMGAADAVAKRNAGADLVKIYTGLIYRGPALVTEAARALQLAPNTARAS